MFTPPPSPLPQFRTTAQVEEEDVATPDAVMGEKQAEKASKQTRLKWTILLVPVILILITMSTRYLSHPIFFDAMAGSSDGWPGTFPDLTNHPPHKRSPQTSSPPDQFSATTAQTSATETKSLELGSSAPAASATPMPQQPIPTVPTSPPTLPTPFPQPFDATLSSNFSTQGCNAFFQNMTQTAPFRDCRPFSLLLSASSGFATAQKNNLSALNTIVWGTCNTDPTTDQCAANMGWFAQELQTVCKIDLQNDVAMAQEALTGLQAFSIMRDAACQVDQPTSTYCFLDAVHNTNPSDFYFYQLALGLPVPNTSTPSCSACTKTVMAIYAQDAKNLSALEQTYEPAASLAASTCGQSYIIDATSSGSMRIRVLSGSWVLTLLLAGVVLLGWS